MVSVKRRFEHDKTKRRVKAKILAATTDQRSWLDYNTLRSDSLLLRMPVEILFSVAQYLTPTSVLSLSLTCRYLNVLFVHNFSWKEFAARLDFSTELDNDRCRKAVLEASRQFASRLDNFGSRRIRGSFDDFSPQDAAQARHWARAALSEKRLWIFRNCLEFLTKQDADDLELLFYASDFPEACRLLLDLGANPNLQSFCVTRFNETPLFAAVEADNEQCVRMLLEAGADPNAIAQEEVPLRRAVGFAEGPRLNAMRALLADQRCSLTALPQWNPAVSALRRNCFLELLDSLPGGPGAHVNALTVSLKNDDVATALYWATDCRDVALMEDLLDRGADPNLSFNVNSRPLMLAAAMLCPETVELLLRRGALVNGTDDGFTTALTYACLAEPKSKKVQTQLDVVEMLFCHGANPNVRGKNIGTPLLIDLVVRWRREQSPVKALLKRFLRHPTILVDDRSDYFSQTALHVAVQLKRTWAVRTLLKYGANPSAENSGRKTPLDLLPRWQLDATANEIRRLLAK